FLFRAKCFRRGLVSHLDEIPDRKIRKRIGVFFSATKVFGECALAVLGKFFKTLIQHDAIFEGSIHPLTIKWYDCVRGIADEASLVLVKPGRAANGYERTRWIIPKIVEQTWHDRHGIWELFVEKTAHIVIGLRCGETAGSFEFPKERAGER